MAWRVEHKNNVIATSQDYSDQILCLASCFVCCSNLGAMAITCFVFCGATCEEATYYEENWGKAAVQEGVADRYEIFAAPAGALGAGWDHWWIKYEPMPGEHFNETLNAPEYLEDMDQTTATAGVQAAIERELEQGHRLAFIGSSNGGHVALELAVKYDAAWLILASSAPLLQQRNLLDSWKRPRVATICEWDIYFGGARAMWNFAREGDAYACWCEGAGHCKESWAEQRRTTRCVRAWLATPQWEMRWQV